MRQPSFNYFMNLPQDRYQLHWLNGYHAELDNTWHVRTIVRGTGSGKYHTVTLPIGALPTLSLGNVFDGNNLTAVPRQSMIYEAAIPNLGDFDEIAVSEVPSGLYVFPTLIGGAERLLRYRTKQGTLYVPSIELARHLFFHNRLLVNAATRPGSLEMLYGAHVPGFYEELTLQFTAEMPAKMLTKEFVREFAWIAVDPSARRAWDSIYLGIMNQNAPGILPPSIPNSTCVFRGVQFGQEWLVLEIIGLSGRNLPCNMLRYGHPSFRQRIVSASEDANGAGVGDVPIPDDEINASGVPKVDYKFELEGGSATNRSASGNVFIDVEPKITTFEKAVRLEKTYLMQNKGPSGTRSGTRVAQSVQRETKILRLAVGEADMHGELPGMEFKILTPASWSTVGDLSCLSSTVRMMADRLPNVVFNMAPCLIKGGRVFSVANRVRRHGLVVSIAPPDRPSIVLLDVQRLGRVKISMLAVRFNSHSGFDDMECDIALILDRLVDRSGRWDRDLELHLADRCSIERIPRLLDPRTENPSDGLITLWCERLIYRLGLESERMPVP